MNPRQIIAFLVLPVLACGAQKRLELSLEALERNNVAMKVQQNETQRKIEDLSNSIMVLQDRLETLKVAAERQPPVQPPVKTRGKKIAKARPRPVEIEEDEASPLGFGQSGGGHLPVIQLTNRDLDDSDRKETAAAIPAPDNPEAARAYNEAFKKFEEGNDPEAIRMLGEFASKYPTHVYADNAVFWIGEGYFRQREFGKAADQFERVARDYPSGNKVPDALLKAASCYLRLNRPADARRTFARIVATYPQSVAAQKARASLSEISDMGNAQRRM